jgi:hypothetical protein
MKDQYSFVNIARAHGNIPVIMISNFNSEVFYGEMMIKMRRKINFVFLRSGGIQGEFDKFLHFFNIIVIINIIIYNLLLL